MSCFWDGLIRGLNANGFDLGKRYGIKNANDIAKYCKNNNKKISKICWNGEELLTSQVEENYEAIKKYDVGTVNKGYLCSTCDPVLFLICDLFNISINHRYLNVDILYTNPRNPDKVIKFKSSRGHFSY